MLLEHQGYKEMNDEHSTTYQPISMGSSIEVLYPIELRGMMREEAEATANSNSECALESEYKLRVYRR